MLKNSFTLDDLENLLVTPAEAARILGTYSATIHTFMARNNKQGICVAGRTHFLRTDVEEVLEKLRRRAA